MKHPNIMEKMITYFGNDVDRIDHASKVYNFADIIAANESIDKMQQKTTLVAAILHDIGIKEAERKYNSNKGKYQEKEGPHVAQQILSELEIQEKIAKRVKFIIGNHHSYDKIDGIDFQMLVEADFLVNIFDEGMSLQQVESIKENIFETETGKRLLQKMYLS